MGLLVSWFDSTAESLLNANDAEMHNIAEENAAREDQTLQIIGVE